MHLDYQSNRNIPLDIWLREKTHEFSRKILEFPRKNLWVPEKKKLYRCSIKFNFQYSPLNLNWSCRVRSEVRKCSIFQWLCENISNIVLWFDEDELDFHVLHIFSDRMIWVSICLLLHGGLNSLQVQLQNYCQCRSWSVLLYSL